MADVNVDRAWVAIVGALPERLEEHAPAEDAARAPPQRAEQLELDVRQRHRAAAHLDRPAGQVDHEPVRLDALAALVRRHVRLAGATEKRADTRAELADRERLRDVVIGAELQPEHLVELVVARGQHDDRHRARRPQPLADLEPVEPRQHQVEHDEVDRLLGEQPQRLLAVASLDNNISVLLERERQDGAHGVLVVDQQNRGRVVGHRRSGGARIAPEMARPPRRARRGSLERPVNSRLYCGSFAVVALAVLLLAFSIVRPVALPPPQLPPNFDGSTTRELATYLATHYPDRSPGGAGSVAGAGWFRDHMRQYDLPISSDTWTVTIPGRGRTRLQNLWAVARGSSRQAIVVMAHRDDPGDGTGAN